MILPFMRFGDCAICHGVLESLCQASSVPAYRSHASFARSNTTDFTISRSVMSSRN